MKVVALKSNSKRSKAHYVKEESEDSEENSEEDELSLISRKVSRLLKRRQSSPKGPRNTKSRFESTSGQKEIVEKDEVICYECKEPGHYKTECPKLKKSKKIKDPHKGKKGLMVTWDESDSEDPEEEHAAIALMVRTQEDLEDESISEAE
jgi:hypothetical protein